MDLSKIKNQFLKDIQEIKNEKDLDGIRIKYLGRKGEINLVLRSLRNLSDNQKRIIGKEANNLKKEIHELINKKKKEFLEKSIQEVSENKIDITAPGKKLISGHLHPLTLMMRKIEETFQAMGFKVIDGPEIENEYYNFDALNIPPAHPARDIWNTFWLKDKKIPRLLLRTHTSPMQVRFMEKNNPPFRIIVPGRVFRYEATDSSHSHTFYQLEGLMVDKEVSIANFKSVVEEFLRRIFGRDTEMRIRPSYFPFVEPGFEVDMRYQNQGWLEIMGAGMVHPNVFKAAGYVPFNWRGFAFGLGIDRIAMLKYKINDIRLFYSGDLKFLNHF